MRPSVLVRLAVMMILCLLTTGFSLNDLTPERIEAITSTLKSIGKAARPLSDDEEYYVGRAVAAHLTATYPLYRDNQLTDYLNQIGQIIALHTDKPTTFG